MTQIKQATTEATWVSVGQQHDLVPDGGVGARVGDHHIAIFWLPEGQGALYALSNYCPFSQAHILARGIVGDIKGEPVVASPLYKQHFSLRTGRCLEEDGVQVAVWPVRLNGDQIEVFSQPMSVDVLKADSEEAAA
ncbi:MAG: nitrite reductase small subunit NirD [Natronospirillum sp.]